ncbi:hypothetical protein KCP73_19650 [Salmonella enterica subsp. enterica]|nr:hypothetical protein KCP73_19650 [Salmonella enterica subsp. enterica]
MQPARSIRRERCQSARIVALSGVRSRRWRRPAFSSGREMEGKFVGMGTTPTLDGGMTGHALASSPNCRCYKEIGLPQPSFLSRLNRR